MNVIDAITTRISTRAFLSTPVTEAQLRDILNLARWAPSGGNMQPWRVYGLSGDSMVRFRKQVMEEAADNPMGDETIFPMYPLKVKEPYRNRRYQCGEDMYATIQIPREDKGARFVQVARNFEFFGAPAAFFFAIDKSMAPGQWAHLGMFMQTVALVAHEQGLASCMQEFWMMRHKLVRSFFNIGDELQVYCGMAIGYADKSHPINSLRTSRAPVDEFASFSS
jgi:nitroreductase